jgi:Pre-mRNA-splicing factor of RES complex
VYRDVTGRAVDLEQLEAERRAAKPEPEAPEWGVGLKQQREAEDRRREMLAEAAKPFARSRCA